MEKIDTTMVTFERNAGDPLSEEAMEDLKALAAMRDEDIEFSDIPPLRRAGRRTRSDSMRFSRRGKRSNEVTCYCPLGMTGYHVNALKFASVPSFIRPPS